MSVLVVYNTLTICFFMFGYELDNSYSSEYTVVREHDDYRAKVIIDTYINFGEYNLLSNISEFHGEHHSFAKIETKGNYYRVAPKVYNFQAKEIKYISTEQVGPPELFPILANRSDSQRRTSKYNRNIVLNNEGEIMTVLSYRNGGQILSFSRK